MKTRSMANARLISAVSAAVSEDRARRTEVAIEVFTPIAYQIPPTIAPTVAAPITRG